MFFKKKDVYVPQRAKLPPNVKSPPKIKMPPKPGTPVSTTPVSTTPVSTTPVSTTPAATTPVSTTPVSTTPVSTTPVSTASVSAASVPAPKPAAPAASPKPSPQSYPPKISPPKKLPQPASQPTQQPAAPAPSPQTYPPRTSQSVPQSYPPKQPSSYVSNAPPIELYKPKPDKQTRQFGMGCLIVPIIIFLAVAGFAAFLNWGPAAQTEPILASLRGTLTANILYVEDERITAVEQGASLETLIEMAAAQIEQAEDAQIVLHEQELTLESAFAFPWDTVSPAAAAQRLAGVLRYSVVEMEYAQYTVRPGDTFENIAEQHNMTIAELLDANPELESASILRVGDVLNVAG